jgi:hypothetical protein
MKTESLSDVEQAAIDEAHDLCNERVEKLSAAFKVACARETRERDRAEFRLLQAIAQRTNVPVEILRPVRDSSGVPIGAHVVDGPPAT